LRPSPAKLKDRKLLSNSEPKVDEKLAVAHGLKPDEYERLVALIGRTPTFTELGIV
jgi:phosphoribosylformylglycinamidine synthase subunit PurL